jgi:hypothetical protein
MPLATCPTAILIEYVDAPLPGPAPRGRPGRNAALGDALLAMQPGGQALDVNRSLKATTQFIWRVRQRGNQALRFKVRAMRPGWTRIWRVA